MWRVEGGGREGERERGRERERERGRGEFFWNSGNLGIEILGIEILGIEILGIEILGIEMQITWNSRLGCPSARVI